MSGVAIDGSIAVVTGASSGIGRATAVALAERGASVVLAARDADTLDAVAEECRRAGGKSLAVPTDVSREDDVEHLGAEAVEHFGRIDVWINNAAVMAYGAFWEIPVDTYRHVIDTNLFGTVHGARVALDHFRDREAGVLINVASLYGRITSPYVSPYVVSKFAIVGLTRCLRQETASLDGVDVSAILPEAVDTPIFRHAANYTGREITALPAVMDPQRVVGAILRCVENPKREVVVGAAGRLFALGRLLLPGIYTHLAPRAMDRLGLRSSDAAPSDGNVFGPRPDWNQVDGRWRAERRTLRRGAAGVIAAAAAVPVAAMAWRRTH